MTLYKEKYRIESARKPGWDYSTPGYYFITVCTYNRKCLFGNVVDEKMHLNDFGYIVQNEWDRSFVIRRELIRDEFVVMPNHFHGIVRLVPGSGSGSGPGSGPVETSGRTSLHEPHEPHAPPQLRPKSISSFMAGVKSIITKRINKMRNTPGACVLQYRFHDHVIRDDHELYRIRQYIKNNPLNWNNDKLNGYTRNVLMEPAARYEEEIWMV